LPIYCFAVNGSQKTVKLRATLKQKETVYVPNHSTYRTTNISRIIQSEISPHNSINDIINLPIPKLMFIECPIISVTYEVVVTLDIPLARDLHTVFPAITKQFVRFNH